MPYTGQYVSIPVSIRVNTGQYGPYTERNFRLNLDQTDKNFHTETNTGS